MFQHATYNLVFPFPCLLLDGCRLSYQSAASDFIFSTTILTLGGSSSSIFSISKSSIRSCIQTIDNSGVNYPFNSTISASALLSCLGIASIALCYLQACMRVYIINSTMLILYFWMFVFFIKICCCQFYKIFGRIIKIKTGSKELKWFQSGHYA